MIIDNYSGLLVASGDSPFHMWVAGCAACGGTARNPHKTACELPEAVRGQKETWVVTNFVLLGTRHPLAEEHFRI